MVDKANEFTPVSGQSAATIGTKSAKAPEPKKARSGAWLGYLTLLAIVLLAVGGYYLLQELRAKQEGGIDKEHQQIMEVTRQLNAVQSELASLHAQFATVQSKVVTEEAKFERHLSEHTDQFNERLKLTRAELEGQIQHIQRQLNKTRGDLMIADAEYLLSIANQKLHLVGDIKGVLAAMEAADQRLQDSGDPGVFKVREALAEEITVLKRMSPPDIVGMSAQLLAIEAKVRSLPMLLPHVDAVKEKEKEARPEPEAESSGKGLLDETLKDLKGLLTIRRTDKPVKAVLEPVQVEALREVLLLKLEMARAALLRGDDDLFKSNLRSAEAWIEENLDTASAEVKAVRDDIGGLVAKSIRVPLPDVSKSLTLLRNIERLRLEAENGAAKDTAGEIRSGAEP